MAITRRLRVEFSGEHSDLEVVMPDDATVATLIDLLGATTDDLMVSGRIVQPWLRLADAGVVDGAVIDLDQIPSGDLLGVAPVAVVDKLAGRTGPVSQPLAPGTHEFSNDGDSDSSFALLVGDSGAVTVLPRQGPLVVDNEVIQGPTKLHDKILIAGGSRYRVTSPPTIDQELPVVPPPSIARRRTPVPTERRVSPASLPRPVDATPPRLWLNPIPFCLIFGALGIVINPLFFLGSALALAASFALLLHERNEQVASAAAHSEQTAAVIENFSRSVSRQRREVAQLLRDEHTAVPDLVRNAAVGADQFFQRSDDEHDFGRVSVGYGDLPWSVDVDSQFVLDPALEAVLAQNSRLPSVPIEVALTSGPIGISGPRSRVLAVARSLAVQVCSQWSPSHVRVALAAERADLDVWDWCKWAPHLDGERHVATSVDEADRMVSSWRTPGHDWLQVVFVDQPKWLEHEGSLLSTIAGEPGRQSLIVLADTPDELPSCATRIDLQPDGTMTVFRSGRDRIDFVSPSLATVRTTEAIMRAAAWRNGRTDSGTPDERSGFGVRPFQLESPNVQTLAALPLDPPPVPPAPPQAVSEMSSDAGTEPVSAVGSSEPVQSTVIRAAATGDLLDGAALTPPSVPVDDAAIDAESLDPTSDEEIIDLRDRPDDDDAVNDGPGTRWTRPRR